MHKVFVCLLLPGVLFVIGCGKSADEGPDLVLASGIVLLDGKPLAGAGVQFHPAQNSSASHAYFGATDSSGNFALKDRGGREGCEPGQYKVVVSKFALPDGSPIPEGAEGAAVAAEAVEQLPPRYSDPQQTELAHEVPQGGKDDIRIELHSN